MINYLLTGAANQITVDAFLHVAEDSNLRNEFHTNYKQIKEAHK